MFTSERSYYPQSKKVGPTISKIRNVEPPDSGEGQILSHSVRLLLRISRVFGMAPVLMKNTKAGLRVETSPTLHGLQGLFIVGLNVVTFTGVVLDFKSPHPSDRLHNLTLTVAWLSDIFSSALATSVAVYLGKRRLGGIIQCLRSLQKIRTNMDLQTTTESTERKKIAFLLTSIIMKIILVATDESVIVHDMWRADRSKPAAIFYMGYQLTYVMLFFLELQFLFTALEIHAVLKALNNILQELLDSNKKSSSNASTAHKITRKVLREYDLTFAVLRMLAECTSMCLAVLVSTVFVRILIMSYNLIQAILFLKHGTTLWFILVPMWNLTHFISMLMVIEPSHMTQVEISRTGNLVSNLATNYNDELVTEELRKFSLYLQLNQINYSTLGICTLSRKLLITILSTASTYLAIIYQYRVDDNISR